MKKSHKLVGNSRASVERVKKAHSGHKVILKIELRGVTNWHFSRSFRLIFLNIYKHYPSDLILSSSPHSFKPISPAYSVHR